ncbi:RNA polymerase sigma factor [Oceanobacillus sp. J11TS1]|uniref:RNA polymerase sigma factor n=1 Tax=Oceanobacillus sp. J11TS1 TaxID=2807191 RepID=UPI001B0F671C|nr:sigma-70 family RNA polymerase sigma factor [Oceanobacillus sp. J11TS1]GIO21680.1 RNA polymerase sigma factor [Oceanobacillus sp. J11TS1]
MELADRIKQQEEAAFTETMQLYGDYLTRTAFLLLKDYQLSQEIVQDTFFIAFQKIDQLENPNRLKSWLTTIVWNQCRSTMRTLTFKNVFASRHEKLENSVDNGLTPEDNILGIERNMELANAIQKLSYKYREVIILYYYNDLTITEISRLTQTKESTIKSRLKRGRTSLKDVLSTMEVASHARE